ncbi:MAG: hypothetical protein ACHQK8_04425 [Bacteroidia bacterium]
MTLFLTLLGYIILSSLGLWQAIFPNSVITFYSRMYKGKAKMPPTTVIRIIGVAWVIVITVLHLYPVNLFLR